MPLIRRLGFSFPLVVLAASLTLGEAASAAPEEVTLIRIEAFTAGDRPIQLPSSGDFPSLPPVEVYEIDRIADFEVELSDGLPNDPKTAQKLLRKRLGQVADGSRLDLARQSAAGLINAAEYGVDRHPAIVFDDDAVVYGVTDIGEALRHYRRWKGRALR
jgi:integrating conjugative element protein (TIGR03757 family)